MINVDSRMRTRYYMRACGGVVLAACLAPVSAQAYLDPGTGSLIVQGIVGAVAAALAAGGYYWGRLKSLFRRDKPDASTSTDADDAERGG